MSEREEAGLRRLKQDLDEAAWPSPELLARYATDPNGLSETEKQLVERALAASPLVADELATLREFDFSRLDDDRRGAEAGALAGSGPAASRWLARLFTGGLLRPSALAATAALVALALWLSLAERASRPTAGHEAPPELAERSAPEGPKAPGAADSPAPPSVDPSALAATEAPPTATPDATPAPAPDARLAASPEAPPTPSTLATPATPSAEPPAETAPTPAPEGEILLAMAMPEYRPAYGLEPQTGSDWIVRSDAPTAESIVALVPDHVARACSASPVLHWSIDRVPAAGALFLTIVDAEDEPIVLDRPLAAPARAGLQRLDLARLGIALPSGRALRWSVALRADEAAPPSAFDFGWLRVEAPDAAQATGLAARGEADRAAGYAELGCYSEALEAALVVRAAHPGDPAPARAVAKLAEQAGFAPERAAP